MTYVPVSEEELKEHYKVEKTITSTMETGNPAILHNTKQEGEEVRWNR